MNKTDFIHLRTHSSYSLAEGAITPKDLTQLAKKHAMPAVAITDSYNMFASLEFSVAAKNSGIQPIIGGIFRLEYENRTSAQYADNNNSNNMADILLIAKDSAGYKNLLKLVSISYLDDNRKNNAFLTLTDLDQYNEGLLILTGGHKGPIGRLLLDTQFKKAEELLLRLSDIFKDRIYIELMRHGIEEEERCENSFIELAYEHNIPLVATNDVYFSDKNMFEAHDALLCIAHGRYIEEDDRPKCTPEHYFKSAKQMRILFSDLPEALENTVNIAKRCYVMANEREPMLPHFPCHEGKSEAEELAIVAKAGLQERLEKHVFTSDMSTKNKENVAKPYFERLQFELDVIIRMEFPGYFLIVSDYIIWSKKNNIPVGPGRGSGAGSVVAWALKITDLDPLRFGLLFERFLNPERVSMPDFDIDFCQERRDEVIKYVQEKYGYDKVAQIITFGKLQARAVLRDVGRVMQIPYGKVDRICKMIPFNPIDPVTLSKALQMDKALRDEYDSDKETKELIDISLKLEGLNRHASTHAAGVIIADRPLDELIPLYRDPRSDMPVTGYSMKYAESSGLVKFDFLGLKTLTVIAKTCEFIKQKGIEIDISSLPLDDDDTFAMLAKGKSVGVFQLESAGMRDTLRKLKPDSIEDIIAIISLYRPGPMDNIPSYIQRKHGKEKPNYLHPILEGVLKETFGVIIYQEQVMQIAQIMAGYTPGGADLLRRAMGKKIAVEMDAQRELFIEGAIKNGISKDQANYIFDLVAKFAGYGFNKSHAAAYALISYQTAWLKAKYPVEFLAASMNLDLHDTDKILSFKQDASSNYDIEILPPDINKSFDIFVPELLANGDYAIRYALGALKNVGAAAIKKMCKERAQNGKFMDIFDFVSRMDSGIINKRMLESLIKSGAFDKLHNNRKQLFEHVELLLKYGNAAREEKNSKQTSMFDVLGHTSLPKPSLSNIGNWNSIEQLNNEFSAIGFYLTSHPISGYDHMLSKLNVKSSFYVNYELKDGTSYLKMAGVIISRKMRSSPRGRFANLILSDPSGLFETAIYDEEILNESRNLLENGNRVFIEAEIRKDEGGARILIRSLKDLDQVISKQKPIFKIFLEHTSAIDEIKTVLGNKGNGNSSLHFIYTCDNQEIEIELSDKYAVSPAVIEDLQQIKGVKKVLQS